jgi:hypothetical protein
MTAIGAMIENDVLDEIDQLGSRGVLFSRR